MASLSAGQLRGPVTHRKTRRQVPLRRPLSILALSDVSLNNAPRAPLLYPRAMRGGIVAEGGPP